MDVRLFISIFVAVILNGCSTPGTPGTVTRQQTEPAHMTKAILEAVPRGSDLSAARSFMEREGFQCIERTDEPFGDRKGVDFLYCDRPEGYGWVTRRWQVIVIHRDGKVDEVHASTGLTGP